jgi:Protein of unknown function (DUF2778)
MIAENCWGAGCRAQSIASPLSRLLVSVRRHQVLENGFDCCVALGIRGGMTRNSQWRESFRAGYEQAHRRGESRPQRIFGGAALLFVALACGSIAWGNLGGRDAESAVDADGGSVVASNGEEAVKADSLPTAARAYSKLAALLQDYTRRATDQSGDEMLFDSRFSFGVPPGKFVKNPEVVASLPLRGEEAGAKAAAPATAVSLAPAVPPTKTQSRLAAFRDSVRAVAAAARIAATEKPTIFEKLFGKAAPTALAYASAEDDISLEPGTSGRYDHQTAVYDISAHTVYLPDGTQLEAHSGLGARLDDPRFTNERMRGPTPATVYDLKLRESSFHGVEALRLIPVDESKVFGRSGLLAHSYMLGSNGQSNGCVSFRNYTPFLKAYLNHEIKRLVVVSRLD